jgi:adenylate kinase
LEEPKRITIVVGIPGVGKTTVITKTKDILLQSGYNTTVIVFGSVMLSEAKKMGIGDRDQIRKLSLSGQQNLQNLAADYICSVKEDLVIVDTHLFIRTSSGFFPGIPQNVIQKLKPRNLILITATPEEILARRAKDESRNRDMVSIEEIKKELGLAISMISTISILSGSAFEIVDNHQGSSEDTASFIARILTKD